VSTAVLWSGGKDCFAAGLRSGALAQAGTRLVTFVPAGEPAAFRCHPLPLMRAQAGALGLAHELVEIDRAHWEASYRAAFARLASGGVRRVVTGDITPQAWPWLAAAVTAAGLTLETPLAALDDAAASLDVLAAAGAQATVSGMRADCYLPTFLGRPAGRALLREHGLEDPAAFHPCGERGEYHTVLTAIGGHPLVAVDPATCAHVERDGIWALDWPAKATRSAPQTSMSDFL
jgi:diphthamide synthase (EF-2-diphthine--ammonia ligase)